MRRAVVISVCVQVLAGCVSLPQDGDEALLLDAALEAELVLDGGSSRPPVGQPYRGPQCATSGPGWDGGAGMYLDGSDASVPPVGSGDGYGDDGNAGGGADPGFPIADAGMPEPQLPGPERAGDIVITEIMFDPKGRRDDAGEWIELWNASDGALSLEACVLDDGGTTPRKLTALLLEPGAFATIGRGADAGFLPDIVAPLTLTNTSDTVALLCDGIEIDRVSYDGGFVLKAGATLSLDPATSTSIDNDDPANWCSGVDDYGGDLGSPGLPNPSCTPSDAGVL